MESLASRLATAAAAAASSVGTAVSSLDGVREHASRLFDGTLAEEPRKAVDEKTELAKASLELLSEAGSAVLSAALDHSKGLAEGALCQAKEAVMSGVVTPALDAASQAAGEAVQCAADAAVDVVVDVAASAACEVVGLLL